VAWPQNVTVDSADNVYIADSYNNRIRKIDTNGIITTVAGSGGKGYSGDGGPATSAQLNYPNGVAVDSVGNIYISDRQNGCVRKVDPSGTITTVAEGLNTPNDVVVDGLDNLYISSADGIYFLKVAATDLYTPPALNADTTDNIIGQPVTITFTDNSAWRTNITGVSINGAELTPDRYTIEAEKITINSDVFTAADHYLIRVKATGYTDASVIQPIYTGDLLFAPELIVDTSDNTVGQPVNIGFTDNEAWRGAISAIKVNDVELNNDQYTISAGNINIAAAVFTTARAYTITVQANGYIDATASVNMAEPPPRLTITIDDNGDITTKVYLLSELAQMEISKTRVAYTSVDSLPAPKFVAAEGILFEDLLELIEVPLDQIRIMAFVSTDGYVSGMRNRRAVQAFFEKPKYYFPKIKEYWNYNDPYNPLPGAEEGKFEVKPMLALKSYTERFNDGPQWDLMDQKSSPRVCFGQETADDITSGGFAKWVEKISISLLINCPVLTADSTDNNVGKAIEITFTDDETWRGAITEVKVDDTVLESSQYTKEAGKIIIDPSVFTAAGTYTIIIKATGYQDASVNQIVNEKASEELKIKAIEAGGNHTLLLKNDGTVSSFGENFAGQLGDGTNTNRSTPINIKELSNIKSLSAGHGHSLAVEEGGKLWVWGLNIQGQLGDGTNNTPYVPVQNKLLTNVEAVSAGLVHSVALKEDGTVWAWGKNSNGQLGDGTTNDSNIPVQVITLTDALVDLKAVGAGEYHTVALKNDGTVWAWGKNSNGQLGDGTINDSNIPVQVSNLTEVKAIGVGQNHTVALKNDGTVWTWGKNEEGVLGNNTEVDSKVPVQAIGLDGIVAIGVGDLCSFAIKNDDSVWVWGSNERGQLGAGINYFDYRKLPVKAPNLQGIVAISGGKVHSAFLKNDGTVWTCGRNRYGQLGRPVDPQSNVIGEISPVPPILKPVKLTLVKENSILGEAVELEFIDDAEWRDAIIAVTVDGTDLTADNYTVVAGKLTINADVFTEAKEYYIVVKADGFLNASVTQQIQEAVAEPKMPPTLIADTTDNTVGQPVDITFTDDETWRNAITEIKVGDTVLEGSQYTKAEGKITLDGGVFTEVGTYTIVIKATGYEDAIVTQTIKETYYTIIPQADESYSIGKTDDDPGDVVKVFIVDVLTNAANNNPFVLQ
jgi:alpha-tubulin suppressor-like RCC1 family protein